MEGIVETLTELQLDALREVANIGSGTAATALSEMLGRGVDISVPTVHALPLPDAFETVGRPDDPVSGVLVPVHGNLDATVLLAFRGADAAVMCTLLGVEPGSELATSALGEIGNILSASYLRAILTLTGLELEPQPPQVLETTVGTLAADLDALDGTLDP